MVVIEVVEERKEQGIWDRHGLKIYLGVLPGWDWLEEHEHDLDGYEPVVELARPGFHCTVKLKDPKMMKEVARAVMR